MAERVEIKAVASYAAFYVPGYVRILPSEHDEEGEGEVCQSVAAVDIEVIDALAQRWLDALYASRGEANPFENLARPA